MDNPSYLGQWINSLDSALATHVQVIYHWVNVANIDQGAFDQYFFYFNINDFDEKVGLIFIVMLT